MITPIYITLDQVKRSNPCPTTWNRILEIPRIPKHDYSKVFPLSEILTSNVIDDTLWCFRSLPKYSGVLDNFALFCIKEIDVHIRDRKVHACINILEEFLTGSTSLRELRTAIADADEYAYDVSGINEVAYHTTNTITSAASPYIANTVHANSITNAATHAAHAAGYAASGKNPSNPLSDLPFRTFADAYAAERQKQVAYLRMLLDGEV